MDIRNCKRCGGIYNYAGSSVCTGCEKLEQEDFDKIRDYLFEHPNTPATEIHKATGIEVSVITRFLKEGRLKMEGDRDGLSCENCGESISSGRFCQKCLQELQAEFRKAGRPANSTPVSNNNSGINTNSPWSQSKLHTYDHILKKKD